ncbi:MAG: hypothetical protein PVH00_06095 [Gemmatimonadota bacterium]|jgi:hypothetical protein
MRLVLELAFCAFVLFGTKVILGAVVIGWLIPSDPECAACDAPVIPLEPWAGSAWLLRSLGLGRRWCMECGRESMGRLASVRRGVVARSPLSGRFNRRATG